MRSVFFVCLSAVCGIGCHPARAADPGSISCTLYYRPAATEAYPEHEEAVVQVNANEQKSASLGKLQLTLSYTDTAWDGASASVGVAADDLRLMSSLFQFERGERPVNQFHGGHGFTGLIYLTHPTEGGDYQLVCKSDP